jgi:hypothetical protein
VLRHRRWSVTKRPRKAHHERVPDSTGDASRPTIDPEAFLAALLHLSPEDAAEVREQAHEKADPRT